MVAVAILIAVVTAYGGLRIFLARQGGRRLALSAVAFGVAVSGMHYTAMSGMYFRPSLDHGAMAGGLSASAQDLAIVVALLCFVITAGFLLFLVPEPRKPEVRTLAGFDDASVSVVDRLAESDPWVRDRPSAASPLGGLGQPRTAPVARIPLEGADGTHFIDVADVRSVRADAQFTTAAANACRRGRYRRPRRISIPHTSCGSIAAISWRSPMSAWCAKKAMARFWSWTAWWCIACR